MSWRSILAMVGLMGAVACDYSWIAVDNLTTPQLRTPLPYSPAYERHGKTAIVFSWEASVAPASYNQQDIFYRLEVSGDYSFLEWRTETIIVSDITYSMTDVPEPASDLFYDKLYWKVQACLSEDKCSEYSADRVIRMRTLNDLDGDGRSDLLIANDPSGISSVFVYDSWNGTPRKQYQGAVLNDGFGKYISVIDYFSSGFDGRGLLSISAPEAAGGNGRVSVIREQYSGNLSPWMIHGSQGERFGSAVTSAGDVNGDGWSDVLISANRAGGISTGKVYLFLGGPNGPDMVVDAVLSGENGEMFGASILSAGDLDNDGFGDVIIGAPGADGGIGKVYLYYGTSSGFDSIRSELARAVGAREFGYSVAVVPSITRDAAVGLVVGAPGTTNNSGMVCVYVVEPLVKRARPSVVPFVFYTGGGAGERLGSVVSSVGDLDRDGFGDFAIGLPNSQSADKPGQVNLYYGAADLNIRVRSSLSNSTIGSSFGASVGAAGDVDGDGFDDLVVGAPAFNSSTGRLYFYKGSPTPPSSPTTTLDGSSAGERFGSAVAR